VSKKVVHFKRPVAPPGPAVSNRPIAPETWVDAGRAIPEPSLGDALQAPARSAVRPEREEGETSKGVLVAFRAPQRSVEPAFEAQQIVRRSCRTMASVAEAQVVLLFGVQHIAGEWMRLTQDLTFKNLERAEKLAAWGTFAGDLAAPTNLLRATVHDSFECCSRLGRAVAKVSTEAVQVVSGHEAD
jgi:hypothetical protein